MNIFLNIFWLQIAGYDSVLGKLSSLIEIFMMLASTLIIMMKSTRNTVNAFEWIILRGGMSIYGGWLTAATILCAGIFLQRIGFMEEDLPIGDDEQWTAFTLWVALAIYNAAMISEKNPIFGGVFVVVLIAIMDQ